MDELITMNTTARRIDTAELYLIYSNLNSLHDSVLVFDSLQSPPALAWKSIIKCYTSHGLSNQSLASFNEMRALGIFPYQHVFPSVLKACTFLKDLRLGESVHGCIIRLVNLLVRFPERRQIPEHASHLLRCIESNSATISDELEEKGRMQFFYGNVEREAGGNVDVNISASTYQSNVVMEDRATVKIDSVRKVFEMMPIKDIVSWNTVIAGNAQNGVYEEALTMVREMGNANLKPDTFTLSSILPIFSEYADIIKGKEIHSYAIRNGLDADVFIGSSLIDMYAKCTQVEHSLRVFHLLPKRDAISWNSIIAGCVQNGQFDQGLWLFRQMLKEKVKSMHVSFSSVIPACAYLTTLNFGKQLHGYIMRIGFDDNKFIASSLVDMYAKCGNIKTASHAGLVDEGWKYFNGMARDFGIAPGLEHYAVVADLLGRAGKLQEAYDFISSIKIPSTATAQRWKDAAKLRIRMRDKGMKKTPACSWIEVRNKVHCFSAGDESRPHYGKIKEAMNVLLEQIEKEGYVPDTNQVLHDVDGDQKSYLLHIHSEKLAIAYGIISTPAGTTIRVIKNIRVCVDCHTAIKFIAKIVGREIIVRDNSRFHHFSSSEAEEGEFLDEASMISFFENEEGLLIEQLEKEYED
ncbi:putative pentatricopeptide repeat-containing protein [Senna tora]|uniref:Putative pentatricopeptide repeat-containing protein n=1 Tax=Senna tora TaxID=362788 RepID=A0A834SRB7_9FABA|nr:putative pentatricopeptide repeat-containing protein [Senna tora]